MQFSHEIKEYLSTREVIKDSAEAELYAFVLQAVISLQGESRIALVFQNAQADVVQRISALLADVFGVKAGLSSVSGSGIIPSSSMLTVADSSLSKEILNFFGMDALQNERTIDSAYLYDDESFRAFLRGVFLTSGYVTHPKSGYLLEFSFANTVLADSVQEVFLKRNLVFSRRAKNNSAVLYAKNAQIYSRVLALIDAGKYYLEIESEQAARDMRNMMKRKINCETANMNKTVEASLRQVKAIESLIVKKGLASLPEPLAQAAQLRLDWPQAPLSELVTHSKKTVSRSTLDKRLRRLVALADEAGINRGGK